jgi:hypothetical protein
MNPSIKVEDGHNRFPLQSKDFYNLAAPWWCQEFCVNGLRFFVFESFFVPVKQPVAGAVGMWESRVFCGIPKEMWKA